MKKTIMVKCCLMHMYFVLSNTTSGLGVALKILFVLRIIHCSLRKVSMMKARGTETLL